jgi:hypothetical protein
MSQLLTPALYTLHPSPSPPVPGPSDRARAAAIHTENIDYGVRDAAPPDAPSLSPVSPAWSAELHLYAHPGYTAHARRGCGVSLPAPFSFWKGVKRLRSGGKRGGGRYGRCGYE